MSPSADSFRIALGQRNFTVGDLQGNYERIAASVERARARSADLLVLSELALTGYPPNDLLTRESFVTKQLAYLDHVAALTDDEFGLVVGYAEPNPAETGKPLYNAAAVCRGGRVVSRTFKRLLPTYDVFDEHRYFEPAADAGVIDVGTVTTGVSVCEDAWNEPDFWERPLYEADPIADLVGAGADLLVNVSASPFYVGKGPFRDRLFASHAREHGKWLVFVNQVGGNDELVFDGRSLVIGPDGVVYRRLANFEADFATFDVPLNGGDTDGPAPPDSRVELEPASGTEPAPSPELRPVEQASRAIVLGLRDYVHKSGFSDVVVGLSGGVDSSVTAALAAEALGPEHVLGVAMSTRYTSEASERDAEMVARNLDVEFVSIPVDETFEAFLDQLAPVFEGIEPDVTEENLQARIRATTLMALANKFDTLVLATGNVSELATGYTTIYGDMVGALAPLGDCPKKLVYDLARHVNERADEAVVPDSVLEKAPSAELKPDQTDQDVLPPYDTLDAILDRYVDRGESAAEIVEAGIDPATVRRVLSMLHGSEYKRWQAPPVLKISPKAFGIGWRYPLAADYDAVIPGG